MIGQQLQDTTTVAGQGAETPQQFDSLQAAIERTVAQLADSLGAAAGQVAQAIDSPSWWDKGVSFAGMMVALLAFIELRRIYQARRESEERAAARVSAISIPVSRNLKAWVDAIPPEFTRMFTQIDQREWSHQDAVAVRDRVMQWGRRSTMDRIAPMELRIDEMNAQAPFAKEEIRKRAIDITAAFYSAFDLINPVAELPVDNLEGDLGNHFTQQHGRDLGRADALLKTCVEILGAQIDESYKNTRNRLLEPAEPEHEPNN